MDQKIEKVALPTHQQNRERERKKDVTMGKIINLPTIFIFLDLVQIILLFQISYSTSIQICLHKK